MADVCSPSSSCHASTLASLHSHLGQFLNPELGLKRLGSFLPWQNSNGWKVGFMILGLHIAKSDVVPWEFLTRGLALSFASAASGYDDLTANFSNVLSLSRQLKSFMHYKLHLTRLMGKKNAGDTIRNALFVMSMGTNDFIQNYYLEQTRPKQFTVEQYQNYLVSCLSHSIQEMQRLGGTRLVLVGVPPLGCMPLVKTLTGETTCVESYNKVAISLNSKIQKKLENITKTSGMKIVFVDAYDIIENAINNPELYGLTETSKGCCGTGTIEFGESCRGLKTCTDPTKYVFWDSVHPTEKMYKIIAEKALQLLDAKIFV